MRALLLAIALAACTAAVAPTEQVEAQPAPAAPAPVVETPAPAVRDLACAGAMTQGGVALCRTLPNAHIEVDGVITGSADAEGWAVIGFTREQGPEAVVRAVFTEQMSGANGQPPSAIVRRYAIAQREFDIQRVDGLPQQTVTPTEPAVLARIQREAARKQEGFASVANIEGFLDGFILPVDGRVSGRWGNQRVLNGVPASPHFGYDIAAPEGTPVRAPAGGVVTLAEPDMHYEGGLVFIDHGQGLITMYLHMSRLDVRVGDSVAQGQVIGAVGSAGRATGPHLCWRMKFRDRQLDPSLAIEGLAQARAQLATGR